MRSAPAPGGLATPRSWWWPGTSPCTAGPSGRTRQRPSCTPATRRPRPAGPWSRCSAAAAPGCRRGCARWWESPAPCSPSTGWADAGAGHAPRRHPPRALLALARRAAAGVGHVAVVDHPTTGGVWVAVGSRADIRLGVAGATVGFSGPRVIEAMTGVMIGPGANTAESAGAAGLLDAVVPAEDLVDRLAQVVSVLQPDQPATAVTSPSPIGVPDRSGWEQVAASRDAIRPDGVELLTGVLADPVPLAAVDDSVAAAVGRLGGRRVVGCAVAAHRARFVTTAGFRLLCR